jgi:hypothetical protein
MDKEKILYSIKVDDIINVSKEIGINFTENDLRIIEDSISDSMGSTWHDVVETALKVLNQNK